MEYVINFTRKLSMPIKIEAANREEAEKKLFAYVGKKGFDREMRKNGKLCVLHAGMSEKNHMYNRYTGPTNVQKFMNWYNDLPEGTEFSSKQLKDMGFNAHYLMNRAPACKSILANCFVARGVHKVVCYRKGGCAA